MMKLIRMLPLIAVVASAFAADQATVAGLLKDAKFDGKPVKVVAKVVKFQQKTSKKGNVYFVFKLGTEKEFVNVYGQGKLEKAPKDGDKVEVTGKFAREKKLGTRTFKNEIDVTKRQDPKFGVKVVK